MEYLEHEIGYLHVLMEISKELMVVEPDRIVPVIEDGLYEIGQILVAKSITIQLFNDLGDEADDELIHWSIDSSAPVSVPMSEAFMDFFMSGKSYIELGTVEEAFSSEPFKYDTLIRSIMIHGQPIGFMKIELTNQEHLPSLNKMIQHTVDLIAKAVERRMTDTLIYQHSRVAEAAFSVVDSAIISVDQFGRVELLSQAAESLLDCCVGMTVGKFIDDIMELRNDTYDMAIESFIRDMIVGGEYLPFTDPLSLVVNGEHIPITCTIKEKRSSDGQYYGGVVLLKMI